MEVPFVCALILAVCFGVLWRLAVRDYNLLLARAQGHLSKAHADKDALKAQNRALTDQVESQAELLSSHEKRVLQLIDLADDRTKFAVQMRTQNLALAERVAAQSELLRQRAECPAAAIDVLRREAQEAFCV